MSLPPDLVESFLFPFPPKLYHTDVISHSQEYFDAMLHLLSVIHQISAAALHVKLDFFNSHYSPLDSTKLHKEVTGYYLRFAYYPALDASHATAERYGAHTDYECYTILKPDSNDWKDPASGGLQVQLKSGEFIPVSVPPNAFVVNGGDLIERWSNDKWTSAMHRVKKPELTSPAAGRMRQSIAFFTAPRSDAVMHCIEGINGPAKYPPITCGEHVRMKIERTTVAAP
jgi:isopenicillin N synthase-like dioxygenase